MSVLITDVSKGSRADKAGILSGEKLLEINGNEIVDVLDYRFYQTSHEVELLIEDMSGNQRKISVRKGEYEEIGLEFETYLMDKQHSCRNKCIFCFIDQLPKGMRESLYFKDDDSRLSFLFGNYITLTNLTQHEISRIIKMHISPINISVHTTNPELRCKMMNNRFAGKALEVLPEFAKAGIKINCQIVSCPGINDGKELERTLTDLGNLYPSVECIAVVPVGLTRYREGLFPLVEYNKETAAQTLELIEKYGDSFKQKYGSRIVFASDMYALEEAENLSKEISLTLACGTGVAGFMQELMDKITERFENIKINVIGIKNDFFGGGINVSGLVTGRDLINQLKGCDLGEKLLIPSVMLRREGDIFLDDISLEEVENALNIPVVPVSNSGDMLLNEILK